MQLMIFFDFVSNNLLLLPPPSAYLPEAGAT